MLRKLYITLSLFTESQIINILKQAEAAMPVPDLCREHGMSSASFYKWRSKCGGMDTSMVTRIKELEDENRRFKRIYSEERLKAEIMSETIKKVVKPSHRREMAQVAVRAHERLSRSARPAIATRQSYRKMMSVSRTDEFG